MENGWSQDQQPETANILLVDDRPDNLLALETILGDLGQKLVRATSGADALRSLLKQDFAVILLDVQMPGMDGFEARRRLREQASGSPAFLVAMTGFGNEEDKRRTRAAGFDAHLTKPVELDALVTLLNDARERSATSP